MPLTLKTPTGAWRASLARERAAEPPIRSMLFGRERFIQHGHSLAQSHSAQPTGHENTVFRARVSDNLRSLRRSLRALQTLATRSAHQNPAIEWLLDNANVLEEQMAAVGGGAIKQVFAKLPTLPQAPLAGMPRIYGLTWAWIAHSDSQLDLPLLEAYLTAYQAVRPLDLAELWALPLTLRVLLLENLRRLAERAVQIQSARHAANEWIDGARDHQIDALAQPLAHWQQLGVHAAFVFQLDQREADLSGEDALKLRAWLLQHDQACMAFEHGIHNEIAASQQSIRNAIVALRHLDKVDWTALAERTSPTLRLLGEIPLHAQAHLDTRGRTERALQKLARQAGLSEVTVARALLDQCLRQQADPVRQAPPYWLEGEGLDALRRRLGLPARPAVQRWLTLGDPRSRIGHLFLGVSAGAALALAVYVLIGVHDWRSLVFWMWLPWLCVVSSEAVTAVFNRLLSEAVVPRPLARLALDQGLGPDHATLVVIPCMLSSTSTIDALLAQLEQHALSNRDTHARYALASDWVDAPQARAAQDERMLAHAVTGIQRLNLRHAARPFRLFHRSRVWSTSEQCWMGWERKRGKLEQLIDVLHNPANQHFVDLGEVSTLDIRCHHLVTLDADTDMPPGALKAMVGVAAHPLNAPRFDALNGRLLSGHAILQPRLQAPLPSPTQQTWYHRWLGGSTGLDPYAAASSEVYQDLFGTATFTGKGLMDVAACHRLLHGRLPPSQVLSHDLLEGALTRSACLTDVVLMEAAPDHPDVVAARLHRWTRGDWQLFPFLLRASWFPQAGVTVWKMLDNLRRSCVAPASVALLLGAAWGALPLGPVLAVVLAAFGGGALIGALAALAPSRDDIDLRIFYRHGVTQLGHAVVLTAWNVATLAAQAWTMVDAIGRALWRQLVSRRLLLQWTTAASAQAAARKDGPSLAKVHRPSIVIGAIVIAAALRTLPQLPGAAWSLALILGALWVLTPALIWASVRTAPPRLGQHLDEAQRLALRQIASDTWHFFERHVSAEHHHLPPDNVQFAPTVIVAGRTSPTNMGLYLLATVVARSLGELPLQQMVGRLSRTAEAMSRLPRYRGHFYNWYDTRTLEVLPPSYVSTVDSGNLCGHLLAVAQACRDLAQHPDAWPLAAQDAWREAARGLAPLHLQWRGQPALRALSRMTAPDMADPAHWPQDLDLARLLAQARTELDVLSKGMDTAQVWTGSASAHRMLRSQWRRLDTLLQDRGTIAVNQILHLNSLADAFEDMALSMPFGFLYDTKARLFHIGYRVDRQELDANHYDMLASECRLASLLAIAKGDVPAEHWATLSRSTFGWRGDVGIRSWSGSMFEYLMPSLVLDEPRGSLLATATATAVRLQRAAARVHYTPWGVSESGIAGQDQSLAYQYGPQGTPELAVRRTPDDEWVVAPYATMMALIEQPASALKNLQWLEASGARGVDGFYEALDFTPLRQVEGSHCQLVRSHMAHHQGMALLGLFGALTERGARPWLMSHPLMRSVQPLLHEKVPHEVLPLRSRRLPARPARSPSGPLSVVVEGLSDTLPPAHWISNERLSALVDGAGVRQLRLAGRAINRWHDVRLHGGPGIALLSRRAGQGLWRGQDPAQGECLARFQPDRVVHERRHEDYRMRVASWIAPDDDCFVMEVELDHAGTQAIAVELMSYFEVTLTEQLSDQTHPAFSKLFVAAQWWPAQRALSFERRPRHHDEQVPRMAHFISAQKAQVSQVRAGVDRARLLSPQGLGWRLQAPDETPLPPPDASKAPQAMHTGQDPAASLACTVVVPPDTTVRLSFCIATADTDEALYQLMDKYQADHHVRRASNLSYTMASVRQHERQIDPDSWESLLTLNAILASGHRFHHPVAPRLPAGEAPRLDRQLMWRFGLSGERPMVVVHILHAEGIALIRMLKRAMLHWNESGHPVDLVIVNGEAPSYWAPVTHEMQALTRRYEDQIKTHIPAWRRGMIRLLASADLNTHEQWTLDALAHIRLQADGRSLAQQVQRIQRDVAQAAQALHTERTPMQSGRAPVGKALARPPAGQFDRATGAFRFRVQGAMRPTRPWSNVLANPGFGTLVTHQGASFTWAENSNLHQITPWSNDPLSDSSSELFVLQDLDTRQWWVLGRDTADADEVMIVQQPGLTRLTQRMGGIQVEATWSVDGQHAVKQVAIKLSNEGGTTRRLRLVAVHRWCLGSPVRGHRTVSTDVMHWRDHAAGEGLSVQPPFPVLLATQLDHADGFGGATVVSGWRSIEGGRPPDAFEWTCDLDELIGPDGELSLPVRMAQRMGLVGLPGAALSTRLLLPAGASEHRQHLLVHGWDRRQACQRWEMAHAVAPSERLAEQLRAIQDRTRHTRVQSVDERFNALVNHWLPYQVRVCRLWARAGFYQAGGALGYRDQLQDAMALVGDTPEVLARQIVVHASRQFVEGDVQHWWHPHNGAGVRTRFSDDLLWLPLALLLYLAHTDDRALMDQRCPFLEGHEVPVGKEDLYEVPRVSEQAASVFEHAARALDRSLAVGTHGLALMGCGDWNDGMNRVGIEGRGESVWLSWFLAHLLVHMAPWAEDRGEDQRARRWRDASTALTTHIEDQAWDGAWYRRAWFDDGTPLGSRLNDECRIDLIAQAWAVLSGLGQPARARQAMASAMTHLHDPGLRLTALLAPPLQHQQPSAGYIQAYPPGVRENGGQYSHAAVWGLMAMAELNEPAAMWSIFEGISPMHRQADARLGALYGLEPYVVAADIYTGPHHAGKGGWSWYTGSAGWLLRACIESICGVQRRAQGLCVKPCLPRHWPGVELTVSKPQGSTLKIVVMAAEGLGHGLAEQALPAQPATRVVQAGEWVPWDSLRHVSELVVRPAPIEGADHG